MSAKHSPKAYWLSGPWKWWISFVGGIALYTFSLFMFRNGTVSSGSQAMFRIGLLFLACLASGFGLASFVQRQSAGGAKSRQLPSAIDLLIERSPIPIAWADMGGKVMYLNRKFRELFGYTLDDIPTLQQWFLRAYPDPEYRQQLYPLWEALIKETIDKKSGIAPREVRITCKDGSQREVSVSTAIIQGMLLATFTDLTERKQREATLQSSEAFLNTVFGDTPYPMWIGDPTGLLIRINQACCRLLGIAENDVLGRYNVYEDAIVVRKQLGPLIRTAFEDGKTIRFELEYEASHLKLDATGGCPTVILDVSMFPVLNKDGTVKNVVVQHIDITERRMAEEALRKSEERFRSMAEQLIDVLFQTDTAGLLTYVSPSVYAMSGWQPEEVIGNHFAEFLVDLSASQTHLRFKSLLVSGKPAHNVNFNLQRKDGVVFPCEINVSRIVRDNIITGALGIVRDMTAHREAEEAHRIMENQLRQAQKMEAVGRLAGGIAHDFNNLLQVIFGHLDLLQNAILPSDPNREELEGIRISAKRAAELTRQLLAFGRRQVIQPTTIHLNELVQSILKMIRRVIGEDIELRVHTNTDTETVYADRSQIEQVLMNLCVNARDAMPNGGILSIETCPITLDTEFCLDHPWALPGEYALLTVEDTGCGMDAATLAQVFDPFFTTKGLGHGTGLGLATVYGIVKQHNGLIHVYSEPKKGSIFKVYIPRNKGKVTDVETCTNESLPDGKETILVAEDEKAVRDLLRRMLESAGYTVLAAHDGEEALRVFADHADTIRLAILDIIMPKLGGQEVMAHIKAVSPHMRFLFSSGYSENAIHTNFVIEEGLHLIIKPYNRSRLLQNVRRILDSQ